MNLSYLESEPDLDDFVNRFEAGTWPLDQFKHPEHLAIAACYVFDFGLDEGLELMRASLKNYLSASGIVSNEERGYHETLTVFWVHQVSRFVEPGMARLDTARTVVGRLATQRDLWKKYWTYDLMTDPKSRLEWVPPDREAPG